MTARRHLIKLLFINRGGSRIFIFFFGGGGEVAQKIMWAHALHEREASSTFSAVA